MRVSKGAPRPNQWYARYQYFQKYKITPTFSMPCLLAGLTRNPKVEAKNVFNKETEVFRKS